MREKINIVDHHDGSVSIEGTRYSYDLLKEFGCSHPAMVGRIFRVDKKENGLVTVRRLPHIENPVEEDHF